MFFVLFFNEIKLYDSHDLSLAHDLSSVYLTWLTIFSWIYKTVWIQDRLCLYRRAEEPPHKWSCSMQTAVSLASTQPVENSPALSTRWLRLLKVARTSLWAAPSGTTCSLLLPYPLGWVACKSGSNLANHLTHAPGLLLLSFMFAWSTCLAFMLFQRCSHAYYLHGMIYSWHDLLKLARAY